jgi:hypothetical protein
MGDDLTPPVVPEGDEISLRHRTVSGERLGHWERKPPTTAPRGQVPEGHLVSKPLFVSPCRTQGQAENEGMVLIVYAGSESPAAALRERVVFVPTNGHSFAVCQSALLFFPNLSLARSLGAGASTKEDVASSVRRKCSAPMRDLLAVSLHRIHHYPKNPCTS